MAANDGRAFANPIYESSLNSRVSGGWSYPWPERRIVIVVLGQRSHPWTASMGFLL